jgi:hypothetical protein
MLHISFDERFTLLLNSLDNTFPGLLDLEGIGKQLDIVDYTEKYFKTSIAGLSVDANSNVDSSDVITYMKEIVKPIHRLNS